MQTIVVKPFQEDKVIAADLKMIGNMENHHLSEKGKRMKRFILISLSTLIASVVMASTTFTGQTGLTFIPTADVAPVNTINVAVDYYDTDPIGQLPLRATVGIINNLEVAANYQMNNNVGGASIKWVTPYTYLDSKYAIGLALNSKGNNQQLSYEVYGAMRKELPLGFDNVKINLNAALACNVSNATLLLNPAVGVDATLGAIRDLNISMEYIFREDTYALKGSFDMGDGYGIQAGIAKSKMFAGINYTFDYGK